MSIAETVLPEFDHEMAATRKMLERVPEGDDDWTPHPKSMTLGRLASHLANLPMWGTFTMAQTELDLNPPGGVHVTVPFLPLHPSSDQPHPVGGVHESPLGEDWRYWSRPFPRPEEWAQSPTVRTYMRHVHHLFDTL